MYHFFRAFLVLEFLKQRKRYTFQYSITYAQYNNTLVHVQVNPILPKSVTLIHYIAVAKNKSVCGVGGSLLMISGRIDVIMMKKFFQGKARGQYFFLAAWNQWEELGYPYVATCMHVQDPIFVLDLFQCQLFIRRAWYLSFTQLRTCPILITLTKSSLILYQLLVQRLRIIGQ